MTPKIIFGISLLLIAVFWGVAGLRLQRSLAATTTKLRNAEVRRRWLEQDLPQCVAYLWGMRLLTGAIALAGIFILIDQL